MKKIELTKLINNKLERESLTFIDIFKNTIRVSSYEKYIQVLTAVKSTFKDKIPEFYNVACDYVTKMENILSEYQLKEESEIENYINNYFISQLTSSNYNREINMKLIFMESLTNETARSEYTIIQVYKELGYDNLLYYVELLRNPSNLTSYLNDSVKQNVALHYILFKTNHHSTTRLQRMSTANNLYKQMEKNIDESINSIISEKNSYIDFMNDEKSNYKGWFENTDSDYHEWFENSRNNYEKFMKESNKKLENLEKTYSEKLKIEEPSKFMLEKSEEYVEKTKKWAFATIGLSFILLILLGIILSPDIEFNKKIISVNFFSTEMPVYSSIIILAMICLIIYVLRIFIKITMSSKHLSEEYKQKYALTYFYLSLVNTGKIDEKMGNIILSILFAKADTGLIKNDNSNELESIMKTLTSSGK